MNDPSSALTRRFRANLEARAQQILILLEEHRAIPAAATTRRELLGELHTLKGEARMLGLKELSALTHALEEQLTLSTTPDWVLLRSTLEAIVTSLSASTPDATAELLLLTAVEALGLDPGAPSERSGGTPPSSTEETSPEERSEPEQRSSPLARGRSWVQVDARVVDDLCETLSSLLSALGKLQGKSEELSLDAGFRDELERSKSQLADSTVLAYSLRLTPIEPTLNELATHLRLLAEEQGKALQVQVLAHGVQIERGVLSHIWDPLIHLARNALDHGLESVEERGAKPRVGTVEIRAEPQGSHVIVRVSDDGRGVDFARVVERAVERGLVSPGRALDLRKEEILDFLFQPEFSTRKNADELSGRGIGLDLVKRQVETLGGSVTVDSQSGRGTTFKIAVPASITRERLFIFALEHVLYAIPARLVLNVERVEPTTEVESTFLFREQFLPRRSLAAVLSHPIEETETFLAILELSGRHFAVTLPHVLGERELLRRPVGALLSSTTGISASTQLDDGRLVLILDPRSLLQQLGKSRVEAPPRAPLPVFRARRRILIADDSPVVRDLISEVLTSAGYEVQSAKNGKEALELLEASSPSLLVSDVEMPEMDGFELLQAVRRRSQTLPIILLTARGSTEDRRRASALGANAYVAKGEFKSETLVEVVDRFFPRSS